MRELVLASNVTSHIVGHAGNLLRLAPAFSFSMVTTAQASAHNRLLLPCQAMITVPTSF